MGGASASQHLLNEIDSFNHSNSEFQFSQWAAGLSASSPRSVRKAIAAPGFLLQSLARCTLQSNLLVNCQPH